MVKASFLHSDWSFRGGTSSHLQVVDGSAALAYNDLKLPAAFSALANQTAVRQVLHHMSVNLQLLNKLGQSCFPRSSSIHHHLRSRCFQLSLSSRDRPLLSFSQQPCRPLVEYCNHEPVCHRLSNARRTYFCARNPITVYSLRDSRHTPPHQRPGVDQYHHRR